MCSSGCGGAFHLGVWGRFTSGCGGVSTSWYSSSDLWFCSRVDQQNLITADSKSVLKILDSSGCNVYFGVTVLKLEWIHFIKPGC